MITIRLQGGLGNQMFQYATARALAEKNHTNVALDMSWFGQAFDTGTTPRHYELDCFKLDKSIKKYKNHLIIKALYRRSTIHNEPHFHQDPDLLKLPDNTVLNGYFQSEQYFADIRDILLQDFCWQKAPTGKNRALASVLNTDKNSVSLHVRRGDYVTNKNASSFHGLTGLNYYKSATRYLQKQIKVSNYYIFSDDPAWCKAHLKLAHQTTYVDWNTDGAEDMRLMSMCQHNIIANSSFSWWGAWLNQNPAKIVIAPQQWFAHLDSNTKDVIPDSWQKI